MGLLDTIKDWLTGIDQFAYTALNPDGSLTTTVAKWSTDRDAAFDQAQVFVGQVSDAKAWAEVIYDMAQGYIAVAYDESDSAASFWEALDKTWPNNPSVDGWNELGDAWGSATSSATNATKLVPDTAGAAKKTGVQLAVVAGLVVVGLIAWKRR